MSVKEKYFSAKRITGLAVLLALVVVLQAALGTISIGAVQLNFSLIPIVLGAVLYGAVAGGLLGLGVRRRRSGADNHRRGFLFDYLDEFSRRYHAYLPFKNDGCGLCRRLIVQSHRQEKRYVRAVRRVGNGSRHQHRAVYRRVPLHE